MVMEKSSKETLLPMDSTSTEQRTNKITDLETSSTSTNSTVPTPNNIKNVPMASERQLAQILSSTSRRFKKKSSLRSIRKTQQSSDAAHPFWDTQPVPKLKDETKESKIGPMDEKKIVADVRPEPYALPSPFQLVACDITNDQELEEIYTLLSENYVEDDDNMFRFNYSKEFLRWALSPPGYFPEWHIGVRTDKGKLVAFITAIPAELSIFGNALKMSEVNFLCIHKKLRSKRLAPVLIKEVTRRVNLKNLWQAVYTAGVLLTKPVAQCTYYHRSLDIKKLVDIRFTGLTGKMTMSMAQKLYKLPEEPLTSHLRPMQKKDIPQVVTLLKEDLEGRTHIYPIFSKEEAEHILLPRENVVVSYVREQEGKVSDFFTFYILPSTVIGHGKYSLLNAAYAYYYVATSVPLVSLMKDCLIVAKQNKMDVFNALDLGRNEEFIKELKFGKGDGSLRYYLYNYMCPDMEPSKVGLVML